MTSIVMTGRVSIDGIPVQCPGRGSAPYRLTLIATGSGVHASCGEKHRPADGGARAQCFFPLKSLTPANLAALAQAKPGRVRLTLANGKRLEGRLASAGASSSSTGKAAAALAAKGGKGAGKPAPPKPAGRATGGAFVAAMGAVAAVAGAAGQTAAAAGQVATAGASAVGSVAGVAREGIAAGRDGIKAADHAAQRRHQRAMRKGDD
ncbi:hypothetical protein [Streptomyces griseoaurantiacus]|uniref:hypothetical protein n=1 Tax=Streptomyces griseoaurantiacus TaxID=68213 RepID=UPI002E2CA753|nr:hypothetical protein [Streptomyces jietaisiensis]